MASVMVPVLYLALVVGSLLVFSSFYRRRAAAKQIQPYFPSHPTRDTYITLLQTEPPPKDQVIKAALVARAVTDVGRVLQLREDKPALQNLLQKGSVGDDFWNALLAAEKELEAEILDVVSEANSFVPGWGQIIFETASQIMANDKMRSMLENSSKLREETEAIYGPNKRPRPAALESIPTESAPTTPAPSSHAVPPTLMNSTSSSSTNGTLGVPKSPATPASPLKSPLRSLKELAPDNESVASSDAESTMSGGPRTPSKSSKKKKSKK